MTGQLLHWEGKGVGKVNREDDHRTEEKRLGKERRLRKNPPHVLYFLYENDDKIDFSGAQKEITYIYVVCMYPEDQPNENQLDGWGEGAECFG